MKKTLINILLITSVATLVAQPSFTALDIPQFGSTASFRLLYSNAPGTPITFTTGANQTWQIIPISPAEEDTLIMEYLDPASITGAETVAGCNLVIRNTTIPTMLVNYDFVGTTSTEYSYLAYSEFPNLEIVTYDEAEVVMQLPLEFGSEYSSSTTSSNSYFLGLGGIDSVKTVYTTDRQSEVTGWGTLNMDGNTYNTLLLVETYISYYSESNLIDGTWEVQFLNESEPEVNYSFIDPEFGGYVATVSSYIDGNGSTQTFMEYLVESNIILSTPITDAVQNNVKAYPNPSNDMTNLDGLNEGDLIQIFDITGKRVYFQEATTTLQNISTSEFANGVYSLNILSNKTVNSLKLIVAH